MLSTMQVLIVLIKLTNFTTFKLWQEMPGWFWLVVIVLAHVKPIYPMPTLAKPYYDIPSQVMPCPAKPYHLMPSHAKQCHAMPCQAMLSQHIPSYSKLMYQQHRQLTPLLGEMTHISPHIRWRTLGLGQKMVLFTCDTPWVINYFNLLWLPPNKCDVNVSFNLPYGKFFIVRLSKKKLTTVSDWKIRLEIKTPSDSQT
jgi:hypothetical protein